MYMVRKLEFFLKHPRFISFKVELLYRRALNDPDGLYTLAFAEEMCHDVCEESFKALETFLQEKTERG